MSYWDQVLSKRISRRRGLAGVGAGTAAAALLAACGGDDNDGGFRGGRHTGDAMNRAATGER